jgi:membrane-associated protease RseP (regulator of RpoE activity)
MISTAISIIVSCFLVVFSLIAHEMGHWVILRRLNVPILECWLGLGPALFRWRRFRIGMLPIGASLYPEPTHYQALSARQRMAVALGGPVGSALYGLALLIAATQIHFPVARHGIETLAVANFTIALFNMLPIPPLDGFHMLDSLCEHLRRPLSAKAKSMSYRLGNGLVYGLGFFVLARGFF